MENPNAYINYKKLNACLNIRELEYESIEVRASQGEP